VYQAHSDESGGEVYYRTSVRMCNQPDVLKYQNLGGHALIEKTVSAGGVASNQTNTI
jgi:hypothetical protein